MSALQPWPLLSSRPLGNYRIFNLRSDSRRNPRTGAEHDFYVVEARPWVTVVAVTATQHLVMVEQFRHGTGTLELETPAGIMEPTETDPVAAAIRELREETGFEGTEARLIGQIYPNPPLFNNLCTTVLITGCERRHPVDLDAGEDIAVHLVPLAEIPGRVARFEIRHALAVVALYHHELWQRGIGPSSVTAT